MSDAKWTREKPKCRGDYWLRSIREFSSQDKDCPRFVGIVQVCEENIEGALGSTLIAYYWGRKCDQAKHYITEWSGPIAPPGDS